MLRLYSKSTCYDSTTKASNPTSNHHQTGEARRSTLDTRAGTRHHHRTTDPCVRSPCGTNSLVSSSSSDCNPRWSPTSPVTKQASDWATPRQTSSRSGNSDREPPSGTSLHVSQPSTSEKAFDTVEHSSVWKASGGTASRNHPYSYSQSSTTNR